MSNPVLELHDVRKRYGDFEAVRGLSLAVAPGTIYGLLGPNGAGKSSTLRMIVGILEPDAGAIAVLGGRPQEARDRLGYLPEERGLYKKMTAVEAIAYFARLKGVAPNDARARATALLDQYGLHEAKHRKIEALSKGMAQKVQILSTVVHKPQLLVLDEPFAGLDPINQELLEQLIRDQVRNGATLLFSTHVMQHAERLCDRFVMIARGLAVFEGTLAEARRTQPRRVHLSAAGDLGVLGQVPGVRSLARVNGTDIGEWRAELGEGADPQALLRACFERGIGLNHFDLGQASLHDVFISLIKQRELAP